MTTSKPNCCSWNMTIWSQTIFYILLLLFFFFFSPSHWYNRRTSSSHAAWSVILLLGAKAIIYDSCSGNGLVDDVEVLQSVTFAAGYVMMSMPNPRGRNYHTRQNYCFCCCLKKKLLLICFHQCSIFLHHLGHILAKYDQYLLYLVDETYT